MSVITKRIPPGLSANETEIVWDSINKDLLVFHNGRRYLFSETPKVVLNQFLDELINDQEALYLFDKFGPKLMEDRLYIYCKCKYGGFSWEPDAFEGVTKPECWDCGCAGKCILKPLLRGALQVENGKLTAREIEVIRALTTNEYHIGDAVASDLGISSSTLNKHKANIYHKIGVDSIQALAVWASKMLV